MNTHFKMSFLIFYFYFSLIQRTKSMFLSYANMSCQSLVLMLNIQSPHIAMWFHLAKNFPETSREVSWTGIGFGKSSGG